MVLGFVGPMLIGAYEEHVETTSIHEREFVSNPNQEIFILSEIETVSGRTLAYLFSKILDICLLYALSPPNQQIPAITYATPPMITVGE